MEVHKHPHHVTHKKKWTEYLLEFFMLFLAVTLGFFAESFREHLVDKDKEKQYIHGIYQNLKTDSAELERIGKIARNRNKKIDSLIRLLSSGEYRNNEKLTYYIGRFVARTTYFIPNNSAYIQLTSSGGMRLIKNNALLDSLEAYRGRITYIQRNQQKDEFRSEEFLKMSASLFDIKVFNEMVAENGTISMPVVNPKLLGQTVKEINQLCISLHYILVNARFCTEEFNSAIKKGENILALIKKEYHLNE